MVADYKIENENLNKVLYNISKAANSDISLRELYDIIYQELNNVLDAKNLHIALKEKDNDAVRFSYFIDEKDQFDEDSNQFDVSGTLANYNIQSGKSLLVDYQRIHEFAKKGLIKISEIGPLTNEISWLGVPLKIGNNIIGSMAVLNYSIPDIYSEKDIRLMEFVSEQIATVIEKKRIEESLKQSRLEFSHLFQYNPEAMVYIDPEGTIVDVNVRFEELFGFNREELIGKNIDQGFIYPEEVENQGKKMTRMARKKSVKFESIRKKKDGSRFPVTISASPLKINKHTLRIVCIYQDITEQKQNQKLNQVLYHISQAANSPIGLPELYKGIHHELNQVIDAKNFYIAIQDEEFDRLDFVYAYDEKETNFSPEYLTYKNTLTGYLLQKGRSLLLQYSDICDLMNKGHIKNPGELTEKICWLSVPLKIEEMVIGAMTVQHYYNPTCYEEKDVRMMEIVANQVATAIVRKQNEEKITFISFHDSLTGLYNRAYFVEELKRMNNSRYYPLNIVMIDVNGLKAVNDAFGHQKGDQLLKNLAQLLIMTSRKGDIIARLGGDEFAIILPKTSSEDTESFCQRLSDLCRRNRFVPAYLNPNISIGYATQKGFLSDLEELVKEADERMYQNKLFNTKSREKHLLNAFLSILEDRDPHTDNFDTKMSKLALDMGKKVKLNHHDMNKLRLLVLLHDIGKIGIPENILIKKILFHHQNGKRLKIMLR